MSVVFVPKKQRGTAKINQETIQRVRRHVISYLENIVHVNAMLDHNLWTFVLSYLLSYYLLTYYLLISKTDLHMLTFAFTFYVLSSSCWMKTIS